MDAEDYRAARVRHTPEEWLAEIRAIVAEVTPATGPEPPKLTCALCGDERGPEGVLCDCCRSFHLKSAHRPPK